MLPVYVFGYKTTKRVRLIKFSVLLDCHKDKNIYSGDPNVYQTSFVNF